MSWQEMLRRVLDATPSGEVLAVGQAAAAALAEIPGLSGRVRRADTAGELAAGPAAALALVVGTAPEFAALLGPLRDLHAHRTLVAAPADAESPWSHAELMGLGFVRLPAGEGDEMRLYEFDIATYKTTPDWLNNRNWANPKLWDKHRW